MQVPIIEYIVIGGYLALLVGIGLVVKRFNKDDSDYFRSGCKGTWWLVGASAFMVQFSAWTFTGASGAAYEAGWSVMVIFLANAAGYLVAAAVFAPWFRQLRVVTIPEAIRLRFGPVTQQFYAWLTVILGLLYAGIWLSGLAVFCHAVFGFEVSHVVIVIGAIVLIYSTTGGSWAVMSTDFLQTLILIPITIVVAILCLWELGGIGGLVTSVQQQGLADDYALINEPGRFTGKNTYTWFWAAAIFLAQIIKMNTVMASQRYYAVKTGLDARKAALLAGVLMIMGTFIWFIPPMTGRLMFAEQIDAMDGLSKAAEASYAVTSMNLLPVGLTGLMVVAMLSATMSSMDSGLNKNAAMFIRDIMPSLLRSVGIKVDPAKPRLRLAQIASLGFGLLIIGLALYFSSRDDKGVFELMLDVGAMLALPLAVPMLLALFFRKAPPWSAMVSIGIALVASALGFYSEELSSTNWALSGSWLFNGKWSFAAVVFINVAAGTIGFLATIPFWRMSSPAYRTQVDSFFSRMHAPIDFTAEVGEGNDLSQLRIIGSFAITIGVFICLLMLLPNPTSGRLAILFVGSFVGLCGLGLILASRKSSRPLSAPSVDSSLPAIENGTA